MTGHLAKPGGQLPYEHALLEVGVRELSRNTTAVLARVEAGERVVVTRRQCPIAVVLSLAETQDYLLIHSPAVDRMRAEGRAEHRSGESCSLAQLERFTVKFATAASRVYEDLDGRERALLGRSLKQLASRAGRGRAFLTENSSTPGWGIELRPALDGELVVLRAGYVRAVCELLEEEKVVLVLEIVKVSELKRAALGTRATLKHTHRCREVDWNL
ncbi:MAG TPA: type II toxin-antitoxin system prevent-host-death family antitoxin [Solirubrobacterales bacterium]|nr:type II toxin-antitoxin system prevent-host-death family antitoxin [Solirubrobacterales bacterium]